MLKNHRIIIMKRHFKNNPLFEDRSYLKEREKGKDKKGEKERKRERKREKEKDKKGEKERKRERKREK